MSMIALPASRIIFETKLVVLSSGLSSFTVSSSLSINF
jgi:hypothetical protein